jgi:thiopeptide-type bacteriocin biosynthesis protein
VPVALRIPPGNADSGRDRRPPAQTSHVARLVHPGSDWLYAKLYAPTVHHDDLLAGPIHDLVTDLSGSGMVTGWHFVRYADPIPHLRLRFRLSTPAHWSRMAMAVTDAVRPALRDGTAHRLTFDTYEREIERYGGPQGTEVAESIFSADSAAALALIRGAVSGSLTIDRTSLAVISVNALLADLGLPAADREELASQMAGERTGSAAAFRESKHELRALLTPAQLATHKDGPTIQSILDTRRRTIAVSLDGTRTMAGWYPAATDVPASLTHMHCNRMLGTDRVNERLVYGLITRTIHSIHQWPT